MANFNSDILDRVAKGRNHQKQIIIHLIAGYQENINPIQIKRLFKIYD